MFLLVLSLFGFHGVISNDTTWSDTAYLTGDVLVEDGVTLTIAPGTVVFYADNCEWDTAWSFDGKEYPKSIAGWIDFIVEGNLKAVGTIIDTIYLSEFEGFYGPGNVILVRGADSIAYCNITIGQGGLAGYTGMAFSNVEVSIAHSLFREGAGIWGEDARIHMSDTRFSEICAWVGDPGHLLELVGGKLYIEGCYFDNTFSLNGGVISVGSLDSCVIKNTLIEKAKG